MRSYVAATALAAAFVLLPAAAGYAPAMAQDFSITNPTPGPASNWIRQLQSWWNVHAYYPQDASARNEAGDVKVHLVIHANGEVWIDELDKSSGFRALDDAGVYAFHLAILRPLPPAPPGPPAPPLDVYLTVHFVLTRGQAVAANAPVLSKGPFTVTNEPMKGTVADLVQQRTCTGTVVPDWDPPYFVQAVFYHQPDGTKWVKFYNKGVGPQYLPVTEIGASAQWNIHPYMIGQLWWRYSHYAVWPDGDNHLSGVSVDPWGTVDFTCDQQQLAEPVQ